MDIPYDSLHWEWKKLYVSYKKFREFFAHINPRYTQGFFFSNNCKLNLQLYVKDCFERVGDQSLVEIIDSTTVIAKIKGIMPRSLFYNIPC